MRINLLLTAAATAATLFLVSCKDSVTSGLDIPKDAAMVVHINTSSLTSKLSWDEIKASSWFKDMTEKENDSLAKKLFENPENSGVDMKSDFVFFTKRQGKGGYMVFEGKLKDAAAFENTLKQMDKENEVLKDGDLKYVKTGSRNIISWTGSKFVMMSDFPGFNNASPFGGNRNSENTRFSADSLRHFTKALLDLSSSNRLEKDDRFSELAKQSGDVHFWMNADQYLASMAGDYLGMLKMGSLLEGNAAGYTLSFDDGKISVKSKTWYGKEIAKLMEKHKPRVIDDAMLSRIPSNDVVGVMAINIDPAFITEFLKAAGLDGFVNSALADLNLTADQLIGATKGQFLFSVSDLQMKKKEIKLPGYGNVPPSTHSRMEKDANVLVAASVGNKSTFDQLVSMFEEKMKDSKDTTINYKLTNDWLAVSNKSTTVDQFLAGGNNKMPFADKIKGNSFGLYIDLQKVFKGLGGSELNDASDSASYDATVKMWQDVVGTGGDYKNGVSSGEFSINLVDKSKNALKQINEYANKMSAARKLKKKEVWMNEPATDSTAVTPVLVEPAGN